MPDGRMAAPGFRDKFGDVVDRRRSTDFQALRTRKLLNRLNGDGMPFGWTVNPYRGCEIGCVYCYARPTHEYLGHADPGAFERLVFVKEGDPGQLRAELRAARASGLEIAIGTATDPYQPGEGRFRVTRRVLGALREIGGLRVGLTTKSTAIAQDLDLIREVHSRCDLIVNVSLISLDADLLRRLEPRAPRPDLRLDCLASLTRAGIRARLFVMPVLPRITDSERNLRALLAAARSAGAWEAVSNALFLRGSTRAFFLGWIAREFPWLRGAYAELYRNSTHPPPAYRDGLRTTFERLAREEGLAGRSREERIRTEAPARPHQLALRW